MKTLLYLALLINLLNATIGSSGISSANIGGGYSKSKGIEDRGVYDNNSILFS